MAKKLSLIRTVRPKEAGILRFCLNLFLRNNYYAVVNGRVIKKIDGKFQVWRNNTGALRTASGNFMKAGYPGTPDIIGVAADGKFIGIECKRDSKAGLSDPQRAFQEVAHAGYYFRVDSVESALEAQRSLIAVHDNFMSGF